MMTYPYFQISKYVSNFSNTNVAPNASTVLTSQVIQFSSIPRKLYLYAKQSNSIINQNIMNSMNTTDTFMRVDKVNINWDNIDGVLAGAESENLYQFSVQNGLKMSFIDWHGLTYKFGGTVATVGLSGGPVCIELGKDIGLRDNQAEGALDKINFQVNLTVTNVNQTLTLNPDLYVVAVYDGILEIFDNSARAYIGVINQNDILNSPVNHNVSYNQLEKVYGGDFFSKFKDIAGKVVQGLRDTKAISNVLGSVPHPYAQVGANVAKSLGFGARGGVLDGGCDAGCDGGVRGGVLLGGQHASRDKMRNRMKHMR
jgi:hypothetical protein